MGLLEEKGAASWPTAGAVDKADSVKSASNHESPCWSGLGEPKMLLQ